MGEKHTSRRAEPPLPPTAAPDLLSQKTQRCSTKKRNGSGIDRTERRCQQRSRLARRTTTAQHRLPHGPSARLSGATTRIGGRASVEVVGVCGVPLVMVVVVVVRVVVRVNTAAIMGVVEVMMVVSIMMVGISAGLGVEMHIHHGFPDDVGRERRGGGHGRRRWAAAAAATCAECATVHNWGPGAAIVGIAIEVSVASAAGRGGGVVSVGGRAVGRDVAQRRNDRHLHRGIEAYAQARERA